MKKLFLSFVFLATALPHSLTHACDAGTLCRDKASPLETERNKIIADAIDFSKNTSCAILTDKQALYLASLSVLDQISYTDFKRIYPLICNFKVSIEASSFVGRANIFIELIQLSESNPSYCDVLTNDEALKIVKLVEKRKINFKKFKFRYQNSCDIEESMEAARYEK